jgi:carbonic anhydrase
METQVEYMERRPRTGEEALRLLMEGNRKFVEGKLTHYDVVARRKELVNGQQPFAIVLSCSDSRIDPVKTFDADLGGVFAIESAGNVVDDIAVGSVEYGAEHLGAPLLVILAHEKCGAVTACCTGGHCGGHIKDIMKMIEPSVIKGDVEASTDRNARAVKECILHSSEIIRRLVDEGKLKIVVAKYMLESGQVKILE